MAAMLSREAQQGEDGGDGGAIEKIGNEMLKGLSNIFLASTISAADTSNDTEMGSTKVGLFNFRTRLPFHSER